MHYRGLSSYALDSGMILAHDYFLHCCWGLLAFLRVLDLAVRMHSDLLELVLHLLVCGYWLLLLDRYRWLFYVKEALDWFHCLVD